MSPTTIAFPNAWRVSANGQPQDSLTHTAYCVFVSHSSTVQPSPIVIPIKWIWLPTGLIHGSVQAIHPGESQAENKDRDGDDQQK